MQIRCALISFGFALFQLSLLAQDNTILVYNPVTEEVDTIHPVAVTDSVSGFLSNGIGTLPGLITLDNMAAPAGYLGPGNQLPPTAASMNSLTDYPIRAVGALRRIEADSSWARCSGQLVGPWHVLTASHCLRDMFSGEWRTGQIDFNPVFDNGIPSIYGSARAVRYYVPLEWERDNALIELEHPLGEELGWIGLGFTTDSTYFNDKIVHKFSYPADNVAGDPSIIYNGDTLYHFSTPVVLSSAGIANYVGVQNWVGVPGESGSGILVTDNVNYNVLGVDTWAGGYRHTLMDAGTFEQFRTILENPNLSTHDMANTGTAVRVYPNPVLSQATIELSETSPATHKLTVSDMSGRVVSQQEFHGPSCVFLRKNLVAGSYVYRIDNAYGTSLTGKLFLK